MSCKNHVWQGFSALLILLCSGLAGAVGLGELTHRSHLGEPLQASIELVGVADHTPDTVKAQLLSTQEAESLGIVLADNFHRLQLKPEVRDGRLRLSLTTPRPVNEPYLNFLVRLSWPEGTILREYTLLLDLPVAVQVPTASKGELEISPAVPASRQAQPRPPASTELAGPGQRYQVVVGDSLSKIAASIAAATGQPLADLSQWLLEQNPQAFINNNPHLLKAGSWLQFPDPDLTLSPARPATVAAVSSTETELAVTPPADTAQAPPQAALEITSPQAAAGVSSSEAENLSAQLMATRETIDMLLRENRELRMRLDRMEQSGLEESLNQLLALKDQQIAELKQQQKLSDRLAAVRHQREMQTENPAVGVNAGAVSEMTAKSEAQGDSEGSSFIGWAIGLLIAIAGIIGAIWLYFQLRPGDVPLAAAIEGQQNGRKGSLSNRLIRASSVVAPRWRPDNEVHEDIARKMLNYAPVDDVEDHIVVESPIADSIAEALTYARAGSLDLAEAILVTVRVEAGEDSRIAEALDEVESLRAQRGV